MWDALTGTPDAITVLPRHGELRCLDEAVATQGGAAMMQVYAKLGLKPSVRPDGQYYVGVGSPDDELR